MLAAKEEVAKLKLKQLQGGRKVPGHSIFNILMLLNIKCSFNILILLKQFI